MNKQLLAAAVTLPVFSATAQIPASTTAQDLEQVTVTASRVEIPKTRPAPPFRF